MNSFSVEELLTQFMHGADENYRQKIKMLGTGFVVATKSIVPKKEGNTVGPSCGIISASQPVHSLDDLRRFAVAIRAAVRLSEATAAGVLCELVIKLDDADPQEMVVLYLDQKYGGLRVYLAPKVGEHLVFRNMGDAHPSVTFLPTLIPTEAYGPSSAEA